MNIKISLSASNKYSRVTRRQQSNYLLPILYANTHVHIHNFFVIQKLSVYYNIYFSYKIETILLGIRGSGI